jgi:hypothetical protein
MRFSSATATDKNAFAGKPGPNPVGAGLPAKAVGQSVKRLDVMTSSQASQLPQFGGVSQNPSQAQNLWELACLRMA